ncbi:hypothetical protein RclHR1_24700003 [Rhizophagus clarus]|uniref:RNase H type-1 domain-containing protein n=1 Tax=Rhizophagus clarus TaxID=94130 RepID=A0A2Z6R2P4_9GLOM|nr:hypothetical protein RclHR1_24700003 [Rhizophagus clarus]
MEPPTLKDLDSLTALVSRNHATANKLRNDLKKCRKLLSKLVTDLLIVSEPATHTQLITNIATLSRMILDGSFSLADLRRQILTDELRLSMWTRDPDLSSNLHEAAPADSVTIEPIVKHLPRLKVFLFIFNKGFYAAFALNLNSGRSLPHKWYLDIQATTTIPDSHDRLYDRYVCSPTNIPATSLVPGVTTNQKNRHWLVTLDGNAAPLFGKQLTVQPKKDTCTIVHWTSDCLSSPGDVIRLHSCPGCEAHVPFPAANKYTTVEPRCTFTVSLLRSLILPTQSERIRPTTTEVVSPYSWADLGTIVASYYTRLSIPPNFSSSLPAVNGDLPGSLVLFGSSSGLPSPVILLPDSHYRYYTDGSLINLGTPAVSMGCHWPSSTRAETAAIYAALCVTPEASVVSIYTDSQAAIDGLRLCASSTYTNSRLYYKPTNFELWASIECCVREKRLSVFPVKVKGHDGNYWNDFADSLANSAHQSDDAFPLPEAIYTSAHSIRLAYDDIVCESNPRRLFKAYYQATYMRDLLSLHRFQFIFCLTDRDDYIVDWDLTWFTLNFSPSHDASFQAQHASRHYTFKFKLFLDDLPLLEKLKITRPDLYIDLLTCRSCCIRKEDLMHFILCSK